MSETETGSSCSGKRPSDSLRRKVMVNREDDQDDGADAGFTATYVIGLLLSVIPLCHSVFFFEC